MFFFILDTMTSPMTTSFKLSYIQQEKKNNLKIIIGHVFLYELLFGETT